MTYSIIVFACNIGKLRYFCLWAGYVCIYISCYCRDVNIGEVISVATTVKHIDGYN